MVLFRTRERERERERETDRERERRERRALLFTTNQKEKKSLFFSQPWVSVKRERSESERE